MTSHDDGESINFTKLERDLMQAVEADARYWRENDAKIRAVQNKVPTYEDFKDLVLAAHLKPLDREDKVSTTFNQPWNSTADRSRLQGQGGSAYQNADGIKQNTDRLPKNGQEFVRDWRRYYKTAEERCAFLLYIGAEKLGQIFKAEISFGLLGDFVTALLLASEKHHTKLVYEILSSFSQVNRFSLAVQFMSGAEKDSARKLFQQLEGQLQSYSDTDADMLSGLHALREVYGIKGINS